jgi:hypothetical protein
MASIRKIKLKHGTAHEVRYSQYGARHSKYFPPEIPYPTVKRFATEIEFNKAHERAGIVAPTGAVSLAALAELYCQRRAAELDTWREALAMKRLVPIVGKLNFIAWERRV